MIYSGKLPHPSSILCTLFMLLLFSSSCIQEDYDTAQRGADTSVELSVRSSAVSIADANKLFDNETAIRSIRVLTFDRYSQAGVPAFEKNQYATLGDGFTDLGGVYTVQMIVQEHDNKEFYVLVNEPAALKSELNAITSVSGLHAMEYTLAAYFNDKLSDAAICFKSGSELGEAPFADLPMFGEALQQSVMANATGVVANAITVNVSRALARVDLKLIKETGTTSVIKLKNDATTFEYTTYTKGNLTDQPHTAVESNQGSATKTFSTGGDVEILAGESALAHVLSFYTPARSCKEVKEKIKITIGNIEYGDKTLTFNPIILDKTTSGDITAIKRNTVYEVKGTIKKNEVDVSVELLPWIAKNIDTDIGGESEIHAPSTVLMNYFDNENSYTKTVSYSGSHEVVIEVGGVEVKYVANNTSLVPTGGVLPVWLTAATWTKTDDISGKLTFTYQISDETSTHLDIALKSGTATRKMLVKYADPAVPFLTESLIDYARFTDEKTGKRGSFTGKIYYSGTIVTNLTTPSPAFPSWLTSVVAGEEGEGSNKRQYIEVTYKPTKVEGRYSFPPKPTGHPKYTIDITDASGQQKGYTLVYDNGFITPEIMNEIEMEGNFKQILGRSDSPASGTHDRNNWAPNGFHFARRGWQGHDGTTAGQNQSSDITLTGGIDPFSSNMLATRTKDALLIWQVSTIKIDELEANDYRYNRGEIYTNILIDRHNKSPIDPTHQHWIAKYCEKTGAGYYLPGVSDIVWIYHYAIPYLGISYMFDDENYWCAVEKDELLAWGINVASGAQFQNGQKHLNGHVRCIRDL